MQIKMIHPNGQNFKMCDPAQAKRLSKLGWAQFSDEPMKEVLDFQKKVAPHPEITEHMKQCCGGACEKPTEQPTEPIVEPIEPTIEPTKEEQPEEVPKQKSKGRPRK